jgi:hypothetical protein
MAIMGSNMTQFKLKDAATDDTEEHGFLKELRNPEAWWIK